MRMPSTPLAWMRAADSFKDPMSPLPNTRMPCRRICAAASAMASQSASPRYSCCKVRPWIEMTSGRPCARQALHFLIITESYPRRVLTDRGRARRSVRGDRCSWVARNPAIRLTIAGLSPASANVCPLAQSCRPRLVAAMISSANSGVLISPAPLPDEATFFDGHPMLMSSPSNPSSLTTCAAW